MTKISLDQQSKRVEIDSLIIDNPIVFGFFDKLSKMIAKIDLHEQSISAYLLN